MTSVGGGCCCQERHGSVVDVMIKASRLADHATNCALRSFFTYSGLWTSYSGLWTSRKLRLGNAVKMNLQLASFVLLAGFLAVHGKTSK